MFGYLNVHSNYSLLRGIANHDDLIKTSLEQGCDALGIVDFNNLYGAIQFYKKANDAGIKPIIGFTLYVSDDSKKELRYNSIVLIATSFEGYKNLMTLVTIANANADPTPHIAFSQLKNYTKDVVCILPQHNSSLREPLIQEDKEQLKKKLDEYKNIYKDKLYVGITQQDLTVRDGTKVESTTEFLCSNISDDIKIIPFPLVYLLNEDYKEARDVLFSIQKHIRTPLEEDFFEDPLVIPNKSEVETWSKKIAPESLKNLSELIESINVEIPIGNWVFPNPPISKDEDPEEVFKKYIEEGYEFRDIEKTKEVEERVNFEFDVIKSKGYIDYFLTVIDLIHFMRKNDILSTTRGSAAGSMISYLTGITNMNPIEYKIPFERFLNPYRPSPPDIDLDIADDKRDIVIDYISKQYGEERVAQIGTLGTMMARAAVRDTARALGYSYITGDKIAKLIPLGKQGMPMYIDTAFDIVPELKTLYNTEDSVKHIIDVAKKIEGNPRHVSVHAAGVAISPTVITDYTPVERDPRDPTKRPITQFNMHSLEDAGLLKFDILGLTNLSILSNAINSIEKDFGIRIDIDKVPLNDKKTFKMISEGLTQGVFQLGSSGMISVLKKLKPTCIQDIAAVIALYRPGPMKNIDEYIARKQGEKSESYFHEEIKPFLKDSYGVLVYQDDLLYTALELAGYNWEEVDVFRKAVGKKIPELFEQQEELFKKKIMEHKGVSKRQADHIWELFTPFAGYGFNKAHAISYGKISYLTGYVKANYPAHYIASYLTAVEGNTDEVASLILEAKNMNIDILPPNLNQSYQGFTNEKQSDGKYSIRVGLSTIKQVGNAAADCIVKERKLHGDFKSLEDFVQRVGSYKVLNRRGIEALIKVGVFDEYSDRSTLLENIELILLSMKESQKPQEQVALFDVNSSVGLTLKPAKERKSDIQLLYWEKELLGVYISGHPLNAFKKEGLRLSDIKKRKSKAKVSFTAVIANIKPFRNKKGEKMYFVTLEDDLNIQLETVCFSKEAEEYEDFIAPYRSVFIKGETTIRNDEVTLRIEEIKNPNFI